MKKQSGMTLIELIVAIVVFGIALSSMVKAMVDMSKENLYLDRKVQAFALMRGYYDEMFEADSFTTLNTFAVTDYVPTQLKGGTQLKDLAELSGSNISKFSLTVAVTEPSAAIQGVPTTEIRRIDMSVKYDTEIIARLTTYMTTDKDKLYQVHY